MAISKLAIESFSGQGPRTTAYRIYEKLDLDLRTIERHHLDRNSIGVTELTVLLRGINRRVLLLFRTAIYRLVSMIYLSLSHYPAALP